MRVQKQSGFAFSFNGEACSTCAGRCCTGASGKIWITPLDAEGMANILGVSFVQFINDYTHRINGRLSLNEKCRPEGDFACVFFDKGCRVYQHRPTQCRTFPFWDRFKRHPEEALKECPGVESD